jgi:hypothetical protein
MFLDKPPTAASGKVTVRYFLRANRASQIKNPIVKIAKPKNATSCSTLALASENPVCANMGSSSSAGNGAYHVHDEFKTQEHQVDDGDPENYLNAPHSFRSPLEKRQLANPARPDSAPVGHNVVAGPKKQTEIHEQQPDRNDAFVRLDVAAGILMQVVRVIRQRGF